MHPGKHCISLVLPPPRLTDSPCERALFADRMHVHLVTLFERALFADRMHVSPCDPFWKSSIRWQNTRFTMWPFLKELYSLTECTFTLWPFLKELFADRMHVSPSHPFWKSSIRWQNARFTLWPFLKELYSLTECTFHLTLFERALFADRMHVHLVTLFERALFADRMHVSPSHPFWKSSIRWQNARFTLWPFLKQLFADRMHVSPCDSFWKSSIRWQNARFTLWPFLKELYSLTECTFHLVTLFERALFADRMHVLPCDPFWKSSIRWQNARFTFWLFLKELYLLTEWTFHLPFLKELYSLTECTFHLVTLFERALFADRMHVSPSDPFWKSSIRWQNARFTLWPFLKELYSLTECMFHLVTLFERVLFADRMHVSPCEPFWKSSIRWQNARFTLWPFLKELYSLTECTFYLVTLFERALFADRMHVSPSDSFWKSSICWQNARFTWLFLKELFADKMHVSPSDSFWKSSIRWQNARFTLWPFLKELFADRMHVSPCDPFWKSSSLTECTFHLVNLFERALFADRMHVSPSDSFWKSSICWQNARFTFSFWKSSSLTECTFHLLTLFERALIADRMHVSPSDSFWKSSLLTECM